MRNCCVCAALVGRSGGATPAAPRNVALSSGMRHPPRPQPGLLLVPHECSSAAAEPRPRRAASGRRKFLSSAETPLVWESLELITNRLSNFGSLELIKLGSLAVLEA